MDSLIFELQIVIYFQLFLSANVRHSMKVKTLIFNHDRLQDVVINKNYSCRPVNLQRIPVSLRHAKAGNPRHGRHELHSLDSGFPAKICDLLSISEGASAAY